MKIFKKISRLFFVGAAVILGLSFLLQKACSKGPDDFEATKFAGENIIQLLHQNKVTCHVINYNKKINQSAVEENVYTIMYSAGLQSGIIHLNSSNGKFMVIDVLDKSGSVIFPK